jgi:RNA 3'-phosphate cyclase
MTGKKKTKTDKKASSSDGPSPIEIDGSQGEGGGQILRTAVSLSAVLGVPIKVVDIRANRPQPGLKAQHLEAVKALQKLCNAQVDGLEVGSKEVLFRPGKVEGGHFTIDIGTAGSVSLVIQTLVLPALWGPKDTFVRIIGGTDVKWAPSIDYTHYVYLSILRLMGAHTNLGLINRGYYPEGGGEVELRICPLEPEGLKPLVIPAQDGEPKVFGSVHTANLPEDVGKRLKSTALKFLVGVKDVKVMSNQWEGRSTGAGITLVSEFKNTLLGADALGEKGKRAEIVAKECVEELLADGKSGATLDHHMADQILPYLALATGPSEFLVREITAHAKTNIDVIEKLVGASFELKAAEDGLTRIKVQPGKKIPICPHIGTEE